MSAAAAGSVLAAPARLAFVGLRRQPGFTPESDASNPEDMRALWLGSAVLVFVAGALAGAVCGRFVPSAHAAESRASSAREQAYYCFEEGNAEALTVKANSAAARGWELVTSGPSSSGAGLWCFRRAR